MPYQKIIIPTILQPDTIIAIFLLKKFGKEKYPGIEKAEIEIRSELPSGETEESLEKKSYLLIDIGGGKFDHHFKEKTASQLVAEDLDLFQDPALAKLLTFAERADKYGLGTISTDPIDKAFGLAGLISSLNKTLPESPQKIFEAISPLIHAHYLEEKRRHKELPEELEQKLKEKKAEIFFVKQKGKKLKVVAIESDNPSIVGWLRSSIGERADVVLQRASSGHTNIITRPLKRVDLRFVVAFLRQEEINVQNRKIEPSPLELIKPGKLAEIPEWYYDLATNSILNGGISPKGTSPTSISFERIKEILKEGLTEIPFKKRHQVETEEGRYFLEIRLPLEVSEKIKDAIKDVPAGIKFHLPQNYHITLFHFGEYKPENFFSFSEKIQSIFKDIDPFFIEINNRNLESGKIPGYQRAFYFLIPDERGGEILKKIRFELEEIFAQTKVPEFFPHLTIANAIAGVEEKVLEGAEIKLKENFKIELLVDKIRLTEIIERPTGQIVYRSKHYFPLGL